MTALPVVVGDHGEVAVPLAVAHLVNPDAVEPVQAGDIEAIGDHVDHDLGHRLPADPQHLGDRRLVHALGHEGDEVLQVTAVAGARAGPGHLLGAHPTTAPTLQPADLGLQPQPRAGQVQVTPPAGVAVIDRPGPPPARAAQLRRAAGAGRPPPRPA